MLIWQLILIQIATFTLIVLFLRWLLYSHIKRALTKLHRLNQQNLAKEEALKEELARAKKQAEGEMARVKAEAEAFKKRLKAESESEAVRILENTRKKAKKISEDAEQQGRQKVSEMVSQAKEQTADTACDIVKYIFSQSIQKNIQALLIDELIDEVGNISSQDLKVEKGKMDVVSAFELDNSQKIKLKDLLSSKLNKEITISNHIDKTIVAGIILKSEGFIADGSIKNKFEKILPIVKGQAHSSER